ncbi:uncharacterized protein LOC116920821 [Daphnia magna]|uniref:uncharacterized protein LOC116920821 n=1 Tax=Daphnia magna TaxID=35525 RepID=UPI001E1BB5C6|nr:uncharacterized protein LOC116920821 [Daphnia magna]
MAKVSFISIVLCALASLSVSFAEPSTYGAMPPPAMYPPPAKYEAPPPAPTPAPAKYEAPAPAPVKYEAPAPAPVKYEAPAPVKYEAPAPVKYEEKKEKYPMKTEYKKMEYGGKKYRRSVAGDEKEEAKNDVKQDVTASAKRVQRLRDAVMKDIVSDPIWGLRFGFRRYPYFGLGYRRFPYYGLGYRRFGYRRFWDGEQDSAAQTSSHFDMENDDHLAESDAVSTPKRNWLTEDDLDEMMDAAPQGRWWAPQEMDEMMDAAPKRKWRSPEEFDDLMDPIAMGTRCIWMGGRLIC